MYKEKRIGVIIAAAGLGTRIGGKIPKQYMKIHGQPIIKMTVDAFEKNKYVDSICVVTNDSYLTECSRIFEGYQKIKCIVRGGNERQDSIANALRTFFQKETFDYIMIHDGARPYVTDEVIEDGLATVLRHGACVAAVPVKDTIRHGNLTLERKDLFIIQTPQTFEKSIIEKAYQRAYSDGYYGTDDGGLVERTGITVAMSKGDYSNIKITTKEDLPMETRVGTGYDVHRLTYGRKLIIGGVDISAAKGLLGHSDADVLVHAIMDALLGAAALKDIGTYFPDTDMAYKGISSIKLLEEVGQLLKNEGCSVGNIDATIMAQEPKMAPHIDKMRVNIARALDITVSKVGIKATTTERLGFIGREEGIAAEAVCILNK